MKRILYGLFLFISAFFFIDNVSALGYIDSASEGTSLATFYATYGHTQLYGKNGTDTSCDINTDAALECYKNGKLSLLTAGEVDIGINTSISFLSSVPIKYGKTYKVTINYQVNGSEYLYLKDHWRIDRDTYIVSDFSSTCTSLNCQITYTFTSREDSDYVWIQGNNSDYRYTFNQFNAYVPYLYMPKVEEVSYTPPPIPSGSDVVYFDTKSSNFKSTYDNLSDKLDEILNTLKNNNPNNYRWALYIGNDSNGGFISLNLLPSNFSSNPTISDYAYCYVTASKYSSYYYNSGGCYTNSVATKRYTFRNNSSISSLKSDLALSFSNISGKTTGSNIIQHSNLNHFNFINNEYDYFSNNNYFILPYSANVPIYNYSRSTGSTFYPIKIGDYNLSFNSGSYLEPSDSFFDLDYDEYTLSNIEYSAIEVTFNVSDFPMVDNGNNINLDYSVKLDTKMSIPLLPIPQEKVYRSMVSSDYEIGTTLNLLFDEKANEYSYSGIKTYKYWNSITYRFEFPFTSDYVGNITLRFRSDSPYTIKLEKRSNEENDIKYDELDLTGKYGVGFIPKVSTLDVYNDFYGIFKIPYQNNYRLMFYESYERQNLIVDKTLLSLENYEYKFTKKNVNSYLLFINNNFKKGSNASILYNSNYFNYCILDDSISTCDIVNPNNDENVSISPNLSDLDNFGLKNIFNSFLSFSNSTNFILDNVTNFYNNFLPKELQAFFFISFGFVVIIIITKIVL